MSEMGWDEEDGWERVGWWKWVKIKVKMDNKDGIRLIRLVMVYK